MRDKAQSIRRTVSRLRASHEAMRVAQAVIHQEPEEYTRATCARCGREIDPMKLDLDVVPDGLICPRCGERISMPTYLRGVVLRLPVRRRFRKPWDDPNRAAPVPIAEMYYDDAGDWIEKRTLMLVFVCLISVIVVAICLLTRI